MEQEPQVITVTQKHYRLFDTLTIMLFLCFVLLIIGGCVSAASILPSFVTLFEGMNLVLPLPTKIFIMMMKPGGGLALTLGMGVMLILVLMVLVVYLVRRARSDFMAAVITGMTAFLVLLFTMLLVLSLVVMAISLPFLTMTGNLH
jgi:hypothetical protein